VDHEHYRRAEEALWRSVGREPTERWLALERTGAEVRIQEVGEGRPVVLVHGASNAGSSWASLAARLDGTRCILLDRPGCGLSPRPARRFEDMAALGTFADALVVDLLDALGVPEADVIGTSFGGYFALRAAAAHPERVRRLVVLSWTFGAPARTTPLVMRVATLPALGRLAARIPPNEPMARMMLKQIGLGHALESGRFGPTEMAWFLSLLRDTDTLRNEIDSAPRIIGLRGFNEETLLPREVLAEVACPALFLWGEDDPMGGAEIARRFTSELPGAQLEMLAEAGHAPWMDDPDLVAGRVGGFLGTSLPPARERPV
jgi:2-hydroxy-6-oxonona-2,4-dienedioate hydrolase